MSCSCVGHCRFGAVFCSGCGTPLALGCTALQAAEQELEPAAELESGEPAAELVSGEPAAELESGEPAAELEVVPQD